jgi:hypothetical protein
MPPIPVTGQPSVGLALARAGLSEGDLRADEESNSSSSTSSRPHLPGKSEISASRNRPDTICGGGVLDRRKPEMRGALIRKYGLYSGGPGADGDGTAGRSF